MNDSFKVLWYPADFGRSPSPEEVNLQKFHSTIEFSHLVLHAPGFKVLINPIAVLKGSIKLFWFER